MHLEAWISVASVASAPVTLVAAGVAGWQAREARRQAKAAEDQVREARRSATAAEDQVGIMRRQHEPDQAERDERNVERRKREMEQASLITIEVDYSDYEHPYEQEYAMARVRIINKGEQIVRLLRVESIGDDGEVRFGAAIGGFGDGEPLYSPPEVFRPREVHGVAFEHLDATGRPINVDNNIFAATSPIKKFVDVDDVTITFTDLSGVRWERAGNRQLVRMG
jgi:hypothetical protein